MPGSSRCASSQSVVTRGSSGMSAAPSRRTGSREWFHSIPHSLVPPLEEFVVAGVGFGELAGSLFVVFAQATFDYLVLQVVFESLDPAPRSAAELLHELVAVEWALEPLDLVFGAHFVHTVLEAAPGLLGYAPPPRGAPCD